MIHDNSRPSISYRKIRTSQCQMLSLGERESFTLLLGLVYIDLLSTVPVCICVCERVCVCIFFPQERCNLY